MRRVLVRNPWRSAGLLLLLLGLLACGDAEPRAAAPAEEVPVKVGLVGLDDRNLPVIVLEEEGGPRVLHIWIGMSEARSIALEMEERSSPRPNTHDLAKRVIQGLEGEVERRGESIEIDARPSDAIAIALRTKSNIFVRAAVFDAAGGLADPSDEGRPIESAPQDLPDAQAIGI